ncbi:hypothetical protein [Azospirillum endophyticum]
MAAIMLRLRRNQCTAPSVCDIFAGAEGGLGKPLAANTDILI